MQDENKKIYNNFNQFLENIEKKNINNKTDKVKMKIYNKKVKEELEEKMRKEEEELKRLGL
jgi:ribosomal protein S20